MTNKLISIVIPVYNEELNVKEVHKAVNVLFKSLPQYLYEIIFVDDGSHDRTPDIIEQIAEDDQRVKFLEFSRNFGKEIATTAGINHAKGDAVMMIDADLQHPVELVPKFIDKWEKGAEVVIGVREENQGEGFIKRAGSKLYYLLIGMISDTKIIAQGTDFRLLDRKVVNAFNKFVETNRITRGLIDWLGFKRRFVYFKANERKYGQAAYNIWKLLKLAFDSFVAHSLFPLKLAGYLGLSIILVSGPLGLFILVEKYFLHDPWNMHFSGPAILAVIILFLNGVVLGCLGLIALYIGNIHVEVNDRPIYVIRNKKI